MISTPSRPDAATLGSVTPQRLDSNQQGLPVPYFCGRHWFPLTWIVSDVHNLVVTKKSSGSKSDKAGVANESATCDVAGRAAFGPADYLEAIEVNGKIVWSGGISRDGSHPEHTGDIVIPDVATVRLHWGTGTGTGDFLVLNNIGEEHPYYRWRVICELHNLVCTSSGSLPNVRVLLERAPQFAGMDGNRSREGANPVTACAELLENKLYGLGRTGLVSVTPSAALATSLRNRTLTVAVPGDPTHTARMHYQSFAITERMTLGAFLARVFENYDGWVRQSGEQLEFGRFSHDGIDTSTLPELTLHDLAEDPELPSPAPDAPGVITDAIVTGPDREWGMQDSWQKYPNDAARGKLKKTILETFTREFICTSYQQMAQAQELATYGAKPKRTGTLHFRREKVAGLRPGDLFILNYEPRAQREVFRITKRTDPARGGVVDLDVESERSVDPLDYVAPRDPVPDLPSPAAPTAIALARVFQVPSKWAADPAPHLLILAARPAAHVRGYRVLYSDDDASYDRIASSREWALPMLLTAAVSTGAASFNITLADAGWDLALLAEQSAKAQADDTLLLIVDYEIMSIGAVTALGSGVYTVGVLRARRGSDAGSHASGATAYIIARADCDLLAYAVFPRTTTAAWIKLPSYAAEDQDASAALKLAFTFADRGVAAATDFAATAQTEAVNLTWTTPDQPDIVLVEIFEQAHGAGTPATGATPNFTVLVKPGKKGSKLRALAAGTTKDYYARWVDSGENKSAFTAAAVATALAAPTGPQGIPGLNGTNGAPGAPGANGLTSYFHVGYANSSDGSVGFNQTSGTYIGTYVDFTAADSSDYHAYTWRLLKGADGANGTNGIPGTNGIDGQTSYLHIKYSNDGGAHFTASSGETPGTYIGTCVDFNLADPTTVGAYTWAQIRGDTGPAGSGALGTVNGTGHATGTTRVTVASLTAACDANTRLIVVSGSLSADSGNATGMGILLELYIDGTYIQTVAGLTLNPGVSSTFNTFTKGRSETAGTHTWALKVYAGSSGFGGTATADLTVT